MFSGSTLFSVTPGWYKAQAWVKKSCSLNIVQQVNRSLSKLLNIGNAKGCHKLTPSCCQSLNKIPHLNVASISHLTDPVEILIAQIEEDQKKLDEAKAAAGM